MVESNLVMLAIELEKKIDREANLSLLEVREV
jgi:hypothetical protein